MKVRIVGLHEEPYKIRETGAEGISKKIYVEEISNISVPGLRGNMVKVVKANQADLSNFKVGATYLLDVVERNFKDGKRSLCLGSYCEEVKA